jgi:GNAT superfamily N-acetyltransferase
MDSKYTFQPVTKSKWNQFEALFGPRGACAGCWCMWWRLPRSEFNRRKGKGNRQAMKKIIESGQIPGILALVDGTPIGWCSIEPRENFPALDRSRNLKCIDDLPVWSIVCFFVAKNFRRRGLTKELINAAVEYARKRGATIVESYPIEVASGSYPDAFAYTGFSSAFISTGFKAVARRSERRAMYRLYL